MYYVTSDGERVRVPREVEAGDQEAFDAWLDEEGLEPPEAEDPAETPPEEPDAPQADTESEPEALAEDREVVGVEDLAPDEE